MDNLEQSAVFDAGGNWMQTEIEMKTSALPEAIQQTIAKQFTGYKIEKAEKFDDVLHGNCFEVEIEKGEETFDVLLKANGEIISKKAAEEDKDEKD